MLAGGITALLFLLENIPFDTSVKQDQDFLSEIVAILVNLTLDGLDMDSFSKSLTNPNSNSLCLLSHVQRSAGENCALRMELESSRGWLN